MVGLSSLEIVSLDPSRVRFERIHDSASDLRIHLLDDRTVLSGRVRRAFPLSEPDGCYSVQDGAHAEVGMLLHLDGMDSESLQILNEHLDRVYFTPKISRIVSLKQEGGMWTFEVETSRGDFEFYVRSWRDSSHEISAGRFSIMSVDGQRFEVPDYESLDQKSQILLEQLF